MKFSELRGGNDGNGQESLGHRKSLRNCFVLACFSLMPTGHWHHKSPSAGELRCKKDQRGERLLSSVKSGLRLERLSTSIRRNGSAGTGQSQLKSGRLR